MFDGWLLDKEFLKVVRDCWSEAQPFGWGGYVLKCKLQNLKQRLRNWSKDNYRDMGNKVKQIQLKLNDLENSLSAQPSAQQIQDLKKTQAELWEKATIHESFVRQKSRSKWIKEGNNNSAFFHKVINYSRRKNAMRGLLIEGSWVENPNRIKAEVYGRDPNWGRIAAAAGYSGVSFHQDLLRVELGDILLMDGGEPQLFDR